MTCHEYEAVLWSFDNPPHKKVSFRTQKSKKAKRNCAGARPTSAPPDLLWD